ncbi:MAG: QueT transporter family protein [Lachnospiraceae bacterium]|nr:QueT transporter family protein [Lachnospiraceae bacterium]
MNNKKVQFLTLAAMIAALYVVLTFIANAFGLASGAIQVRLSEALAILPFFTPAAIPGLYIGCLLANLLTGGCLLDILVGSLASLIGALGAYAVRKWKWLVPLPTIIANALIVPFVLIHGYGLADAWWYLFLTVGAGEVISCGILGMGLLLVLRNYSVQLLKTTD